MPPQEPAHSTAGPPTHVLARLAPGILVAATGVGAGDLITAGLAGSELGVGILWAAWLGALLKWALTEGIARWQMATGTTLLEGWTQRLGAWIRWLFLAYLVVWSVAVGGALASACGAAGAALLPLDMDPDHARGVWGVFHALLALGLVWTGGFKLFERLMGVCIAVMFVAVLTTAVLIRPDWNQVAAGALWPSIPDQPNGLRWVLGVLGGVGGTVTLLSYGYWIRECGRAGHTGLSSCRVDLAVGYGLTALFGMAMILIGSRLQVVGGAGFAGNLAAQLEGALGPVGRWIFLGGFWGAVFSSMLGVWQSVPYMFADFVYMRHGPMPQDLTRTTPYRVFLVALAILPLPLLGLELKTVQLVYAVGGALFMPLLAFTLLLMNRRARWVGARFRTHWSMDLLLVLTLALFTWMGLRELGRWF